MKTPMRERFDDTFYEEVNSFMGTAFGDSELDAKLKDFIEQELKIKDQEHKAELESIIQDLEKMMLNTGAVSSLSNAISIIDGHINKLSTE